MERETLEALQEQARRAYERTDSDHAGAYLQAIASFEIALQQERYNELLEEQNSHLRAIAEYLSIIADKR